MINEEEAAGNDLIAEEVFLSDLKAREALERAALAQAAQDLRMQDMPAGLGTTSGPRGADLADLRGMYERLSAMLVGPKEELDWTAARRHLRLLISRWEMETARSEAAREVRSGDV